MLKTLIAIVLVIGIGAAALPPAEDPDMLKVIIDRDGAFFGLFAFQTDDGRWVVGFSDYRHESFYYGNETGTVIIT